MDKLPPKTQMAILQHPTSDPAPALPLLISHCSPIPDIPSPHHVLVRVLAVALNPTDHKMTTHFPMPGHAAGCDFSGVIERAGSSALSAFSAGTRVCGATFPYRVGNATNGAFAQFVAADARQLLKVPAGWSDVQAAALGEVGWGTAALAMADLEALGLEGVPSRPVERPSPVLVYGGATATGLMAVQMLKLSGYAPIAVCSTNSAARVMEYGAIGTASYLSTTCIDDIKSIAGDSSIRHAIDCITDADSARVCFGVMPRTGGRYACLEDFHESWRTRRVVKVKVVMGYELEAETVDFGGDAYTREAKPELHAIGERWAQEIQTLLDGGKIRTQPIRELPGEFEGILEGMRILRAGEAQGQKLVVKIAQADV